MSVSDLGKATGVTGVKPETAASPTTPVPDGAAPPAHATGPERLTIRQVLADAYEQFLTLDSPALRVLRELTLRPGGFVRRYVEGERDGVVGPVKYALLTVTLLVILAQARRSFFPPELLPGLDPSRTEALHAAQDLRTYVLLVILFPTALVQRLVFWRSRYNYAETYAFLAYVLGHQVWLGILEQLLPDAMRFWLSFQIVAATVPIAYILWAICDFHGSRRLSVILRGLVVYAIFALGMLITLQGLITWRLGR